DVNDDKDLDTGANNKQNFAVLSSASISAPSDAPASDVGASSVVTIRVSLNSTPNSSFSIDFYHCSSPCSGSGDQFVGCLPRFLGTSTLTTGADGTVTRDFPFDLGTGVSTGFVNATAMNNQTGDTSEFSTCVQIGTAPPPPTPDFSLAFDQSTVDGQSGTKVKI